MRNIKLILEYDGTDFVGWQTQTNGRSVQEEITKVLQQVFQERVSVHGAGRTDSGVHARGQAANFLTGSSLSLDAIRHALNGLLPEDICIHHVEEASAEFHARHDACSRLYRYRITLKPLAIGRQYRWYVKYTLDLAAMQSAATSLLGDHGFESFCNYAAEVEHYRCLVTQSEWISSAGELSYSVQANRFLHGMVRALVGTMVEIGRGHTSLNAFADIMKARDRTVAGMAAPAHGLCLEQVFY